jgi:transcriptional regulator with XRE-family HTH domain
MATPRRRITPDPTALRLRHLSHALGYGSGAHFARFLGISKGRWNNFERGFPLSRDIIFLLCEKVDGLTSDWLYFGKTAGLPMGLARKLGEAPPEPPPAGRKRRL